MISSLLSFSMRSGLSTPTEGPEAEGHDLKTGTGLADRIMFQRARAGERHFAMIAGTLRREADR